MVTRILYAKLYGFKNIDKPIELFFANKTITLDYFKSSNLKGIYGTNGAGKTGIVRAFNLYKNYVLDRDYITVKNSTFFYKDFINKKVNKPFIEICMAIYLGHNKAPIICKHRVEFSLEDNKLSVNEEEISCCNSLSWYNGSYIPLLRSNKNKIVYFSDGLMPAKSVLEDATTNLISGTSMSLLCWVAAVDKEHVDKNDVLTVGAPFITALNLNIFTCDSDDNVMVYQRLKNILEDEKKTDPLFKNKFGVPLAMDTDEVLKEDYNDYVKNIKNATEFIKVFKPSLKEIKIDCKENDQYIICNKTFVYEDGCEVSSDFESTGIRKLVRLYNCLNESCDSGIAIIDEFDANLHDVYLCAIIDYFKLYSNAQFIFTTHNLSSMEILKGMKHSIDFLESSTIVSWATNGNYSPINIYKNGMISNSPFNIRGSDFIRVFGK